MCKKERKFIFKFNISCICPKQSKVTGKFNNNIIIFILSLFVILIIYEIKYFSNKVIPIYSTEGMPFVMTYKKFEAYKHFLGNLGATESLHYSKGTPTCMLNLSSLGPISANKTDLKLKWVEKQYRDIRPGGFYAPADCRARHKVAILVPYRNRAKNLAIFLNHIHRFLMKQLLEYRIFVIEQYGTGSFNKGSLFNVGFLEAQRFGAWRCYIFHDVDLLPLDERILYSCPRKPTHMSSAVETFQYELPYLKLFGGVTSMTTTQFVAVNGYSNRFRDWGGEDDDMFIRIQASKFPVLRYNKTISKYAALPHKRIMENKINAIKLTSTRRKFRTDGLTSIKYVLVKLKKMKLFTHILADVYPKNLN